MGSRNVMGVGQRSVTANARQHACAPLDGMLDSFENVIRVVSYVQPQQYSRLLYFKYAIDRALLRFERDMVAFGRNLAALNEYLMANQCVTASGLNGTNKTGMKKSRVKYLANIRIYSLVEFYKNLKKLHKCQFFLILKIEINCKTFIFCKNQFYNKS